MTRKIRLRSLTLSALLCLASFWTLSLTPFREDVDPPRIPSPFPLQLPVTPLQQRKITSCGQAAITMAYNYAHPDSPLDELDVIAFSLDNGYYVDDRRPFTSPANMVIIADHYSDRVKTGKVTTQEDGFKLLLKNLRANTPVIIDSWTYLDIPYSDAHFIVVTGISRHLTKKGVYIIHYNDPLTARNESARWDGHGGIWEAWLNNGDPGGSGWWMTLSAP